MLNRVRIDHSPGVISSFFSRLPGGTPVALESVGNWYWIADEIEAACRLLSYIKMRPNGTPLSAPLPHPVKSFLSVSMLAHFVVGAARSIFTGRGALRSGIDMVVVGLGVATTGYLIGALITGHL